MLAEYLGVAAMASTCYDGCGPGVRAARVGEALPGLGSKWGVEKCFVGVSPFSWRWGSGVWRGVAMGTFLWLTTGSE